LSASVAEVVVFASDAKEVVFFIKLVLLLLIVDTEVACLDNGVDKSIFFCSRCLLLLDEENGGLKANRSDSSS
jgi:hypothetical protein